MTVQGARGFAEDPCNGVPSAPDGHARHQSGPGVFDLRVKPHGRLNLIPALVQAIMAGVHEAQAATA